MLAGREIGIPFLSWSLGWAVDLFIFPASTWAGWKSLERDADQGNRGKVALATHKGVWVSCRSVGVTEEWELGKRTWKDALRYFGGGRSCRIWKRLSWSCLRPLWRNTYVNKSVFKTVDKSRFLSAQKGDELVQNSTHIPKVNRCYLNTKICIFSTNNETQNKLPLCTSPYSPFHLVSLLPHKVRQLQLCVKMPLCFSSWSIDWQVLHVYYYLVSVKIIM